jgi:phosphatidylethanolamine/phosphatidyl-N-methylethanolamine N-methyltransferase
VLKPGGEIVIISRFGAEDGLQARLEAAIAPLMKRLGLSSSFKVSRVRNWAERHGGIAVLGVTSGLYFKMIRLRKAA